MGWQSSCKNFYKRLKSLSKKYFLFPLLSLGKIINSGAQTSTGFVHSFNYCRHKTTPPGSSPYEHADSLTLGLSCLALLANIELTIVTRVTALQRLILDELPNELQGFHYADFNAENSIIYIPSYVLSTLSSLISCVFTSINAWLFGRNLTELIFTLGGVSIDDPEWQDIINTTGLIISIYQASCSATSYYSYNILKIQINAKKLADKLLNNEWLWKNLNTQTRLNVVKTIMFTGLNIFSTATFSYFSTKKAIPRFVADLSQGSALDEHSVMLISCLSTITTISTSSLTITPAIYKWMSSLNKNVHHTDHAPFFRLIRMLTLYFFGVIDSLSTGLGNFRGGADLIHDLFHLKHYSFSSIFLSSVSAATGAFSNMIFNVYEGVEDYRAYRIHRVESLRALQLQDGGSSSPSSSLKPLELEMVPLLTTENLLLDHEDKDSSSDSDCFQNTSSTVDFQPLDLSFLINDPGLEDKNISSPSQNKKNEDYSYLHKSTTFFSRKPLTNHLSSSSSSPSKMMPFSQN